MQKTLESSLTLFFPLCPTSNALENPSGSTFNIYLNSDHLSSLLPLPWSKPSSSLICLGYCNSFLTGLPASVFGPFYSSANDSMFAKTLPKAPISLSVKTRSLQWHAQGRSLLYFSDLILSPHTLDPKRQACTHLRTFALVIPFAWNALSQDSCMYQCFTSSKTLVKSHLLNNA